MDNLLSRFDVPGVESGGQGTSRRISSLGVYHVALAFRLVTALGLPLEPAVRLASRLLAPRIDDSVAIFGGLDLWFDREAFIASIDARIGEAVESVMPARRGRPPRRIATNG